MSQADDGEWMCPRCKYHNFAKRTSCRRCKFSTNARETQFQCTLCGRFVSSQSKLDRHLEKHQRSLLNQDVLDGREEEITQAAVQFITEFGGLSRAALHELMCEKFKDTPCWGAVKSRRYVYSGCARSHISWDRQASLFVLAEAPDAVPALFSATTPAPSAGQHDEFPAPPPREDELHELYCLALARIVFVNHNGNKNDIVGVYADRASQGRPLEPEATDDGDDAPILQCYQINRGAYNGHNIAAIAVNTKTGKVIGCEFNHCVLLRSTTAHAEERLVDYLFKTAESCGLEPTEKYSSFLKDVAIYTSLEPCYQCAGKMLMAGVRSCVWLQDDPLIQVKIMKEVSLRDSAYKTIACSAAEVISDFPYTAKLGQAYTTWKERQSAPGAHPFFMPAESSQKASRSTTVPTFLCTDDALEIYEDANDAFLTKVEELPGRCMPEPVSLRTAQEIAHHLSQKTTDFLPANYNRGAHHT